MTARQPAISPYPHLDYRNPRLHPPFIESGANLALLARDGRVARLPFAHLASQSRVPRLLVLVDDVLHRAVLGQIVGAALVEVNGLLADRAREAESTAGWRETAVSRGADIAARSRARRRAAANHAGVRLRQDRQLVGLLIGAGRVGGVGGGLRRRVRRRLQIHRAGEAQRVPAGQQHRLHEQLLAGGTSQLVLHRGCGAASAGRPGVRGEFLVDLLEPRQLGTPAGLPQDAGEGRAPFTDHRRAIEHTSRWSTATKVAVGADFPAIIPIRREWHSRAPFEEKVCRKKVPNKL